MPETTSAATGDPTPTPPPRAQFLALGAALSVVFTVRFAGYGLLVDDAFIGFRYASNLATTGELTFNPGERIEGFSSLLHTLLLAGAALAGCPPPTTATLLGFVAGLLTVLATAVVAWRHLGVSLPIGAASALVLATSPTFVFWAGAGLETALFTLLLLAFWLAMERARPDRGPTVPLAGWLAGVLAVTRPEGHLLVPLVALLLYRRGHGLRASATAGAVAAALPLVATVFRLYYYDAWVPNPALAKLAFTSAAIARGARYVAAGLMDDGLWWLLPAGLIGSLRRGPQRSLAALCLGGAAVVIAEGGDGLYRARLLAPLLPLLLLATASGLDRLFRRGGVWQPLALAVIAPPLLLPLANPSFFRGHSLADVRDWEQRWSQVGAALAPYRTPSALLATNVAGRVPYASGWRTLDLLGLTDRTIATTPIEDAGRGYAGHERANPAYVLWRAPDVLYFSVLDGVPQAWLADRAVAQTVLAQGSLHRYAALFASPALQRDYAPLELPLPDGHRATLFVRRDGALAALLPNH